MLYSIEEVTRRIKQGERLLLAGSEQSLGKLPPGNWIGGTIPYFMGPDGGVCTEDKIFVNEVPAAAASIDIRTYSEQELPSVCEDAPDNGYSFIIIPAGSKAHASYAENAAGYNGIFLKPVVGWIAGVHLSRLGADQPKVFDGGHAAASSESAIVMHVTLPSNKHADVQMVNVFHPGSGDTIMFPEAGFEAKTCTVNGNTENLAEYIARVKPDSKVPLTADYSGSIVNVSIQQVDGANGTVRFYAPVFPDVPYKFAAPVPDYVAEFNRIVLSSQDQADFSCNCILNYLYSGLEGKKTGTITGPITFGEIAHQLLNQTLVQLRIHDLN